MEENYHHIFICVNKKPEDDPRKSCGRSESEKLFTELKSKIKEKQLENIKLTKTYCLGKCSKGPVLLIYPERKYFMINEHSLDRILEYLENKNEIEDLLI